VGVLRKLINRENTERGWGDLSPFFFITNSKKLRMKEYREIMEGLNGDREHDVYKLMAGLKSIGLYDIADLKRKLIREIDFIADGCPVGQEWLSQDDSDEVGVREDLLGMIDELEPEQSRWILDY